NGLAASVEAELEPPVLSGALFALCNQGRHPLKLPYWHNTGFALSYTRSDKLKLKGPKLISPTMTLSEQQLHWLLSGYDVIGHSKIDVAGKQVL
ncbi:IS66 family insertion sequence element accessory protein TnpB, partial [Shewanella sp. SR41-2]|nr:IS66 family insertion sequence element accessory protein TnpB [Shewanella sp. SR41-2]